MAMQDTHTTTQFPTTMESLSSEHSNHCKVCVKRWNRVMSFNKSALQRLVQLKSYLMKSNYIFQK